MSRTWGRCEYAAINAASVDRVAADLVMVDREYRDAGSRLNGREYRVEWFLQKYGRAAA